MPPQLDPRPPPLPALEPSILASNRYCWQPSFPDPSLAAAERSSTIVPLTVDGGSNDATMHVAAPMWCERSDRLAERLQGSLPRAACMGGGLDVKGASAQGGDPIVLLPIQHYLIQCKVDLSFPCLAPIFDPSMF
ncbi:hypothetical protein VPH35_065844 [Triticum aestivum]